MGRSSREGPTARAPRAELSTGSLGLVGGRLCLDFVNTVERRGSDRPRERLATDADLLSWSEAAGVPQAGADGAHPASLEPRGLERVRAHRESLHRLLAAWAEGRAPESRDVDALNAVLALAPPRRRIAYRSGGYLWDRESDGDAVDHVLWSTARSAAELLVSGSPGSVRRCRGDGCGWLFEDLSRNGSRRWCSMSDCGNRAKARRQHAKTRVAGRPRRA